MVTLILLFFTNIISLAGTVNFSNFNSRLEIQSDGKPLNSGFVFVGTIDATELYFNESNWNQSQFITLYQSGGTPINKQVTTGVTFNVNDELSSAEFSNQPPLTVAFETQIDKSKPL